MKKIIFTILTSLMLITGLTGLVISQTGCKSIQSYITNTNNLPQIAQAVNTAANTGTIFALQKDPKSRIYFVAASATLAQLITSTNVVDPNTLANALEQLPVDQLQTPEAQIVLTTIIGVYDIYYQQAVQSSISSNVIASTLLTNLRAGINSGLAAVPAPAAPKNFKVAAPETFGISLKK